MKFETNETYYLDVFVGYVAINIYDISDNILTYELVDVHMTSPIDELDRDHLSYLYYLKSLFNRRKSRIRCNEDGDDYFTVSLPAYTHDYAYNYNVVAGEHGVLRSEVI